MLQRLALASCSLAIAALGCAGRPQPAARTPQPAPRAAPADQLPMRTPDQIEPRTGVDPKPLRPVPVPLDTVVAGTPPPDR